MIAFAAKTPEREAYLNFSEVYLSFPHVIVTRRESSFVGGLEDLHGVKTALIKKVATSDWLKRDGIKVFPYFVDTPLKALEAVSLGKADAAIENLAAATYLT